jgi:CheY-like chemotaxis protein
MRILVADAEGLRAKGLAEACVASGHSVECVAHGAAALELALERLPELVICPLDLPMIDGGRLAEILRSNPRTHDVSFLFLVKDELDAPLPMDPRDGAVVGPWHKEAVLEHIDAVVERGARLGPVRSETEMEGKLSQITVGDLLQLFQMNHKSGTVRITREGASAPDSVLLRGGQVVDASVALADGRSIVGEKALFRILSWEEGRFEFVPGETPEGGRIRKPMRALLLEGLGQLDEWEKRRHELPANDARLRLQIARERLPAGVHPRTLEVLDAVEACGRVGDIVDRCALPDYQVLRVLADLLERECLAVDEPTTVPGGSSVHAHAGAARAGVGHDAASTGGTGDQGDRHQLGPGGAARLLSGAQRVPGFPQQDSAPRRSAGDRRAGDPGPLPAPGRAQPAPRGAALGRKLRAALGRRRPRDAGCDHFAQQPLRGGPRGDRGGLCTASRAPSRRGPAPALGR